jgi:hypothetical protein
MTLVTGISDSSPTENGTKFDAKCPQFAKLGVTYALGQSIRRQTTCSWSMITNKLLQSVYFLLTRDWQDKAEAPPRPRGRGIS